MSNFFGSSSPTPKRPALAATAVKSRSCSVLQASTTARELSFSTAAPAKEWKWNVAVCLPLAGNQLPAGTVVHTEGYWRQRLWQAMTGDESNEATLWLSLNEACEQIRNHSRQFENAADGESSVASCANLPPVAVEVDLQVGSISICVFKKY